VDHYNIQEMQVIQNDQRQGGYTGYTPMKYSSSVHMSCM